MPHKKLVLALGAATLFSSAQLWAAKAVESTTVSCADLNWSAEVLAANPDIADLCQTVFEKDGKLYAKTQIEVVRVRDNTLTFRPIRTDGSLADSRSVTVDDSFRANIAGREYTVDQLRRTQKLNVYLPEDRFALAVEDSDGLDETDTMHVIEEATEMPTTASPLYLIGLVGAALLAVGGFMTRTRKRLG